MINVLEIDVMFILCNYFCFDMKEIYYLRLNLFVEFIDNIFILVFIFLVVFLFIWLNLLLLNLFLLLLLGLVVLEVLVLLFFCLLVVGVNLCVFFEIFDLMLLGVLCRLNVLVMCLRCSCVMLK